MPPMERYALGFCWGTVGGGVLDILAEQSALFAQRCGLELVLKTIVTRDPSRQRDQAAPAGTIISNDIQTILTRPEIAVVLHFGGRDDSGQRSAIACLSAGKHVVTANKALLAEHGDELFAAAQAAGVNIAFEAQSQRAYLLLPAYAMAS